MTSKIVEKNLLRLTSKNSFFLLIDYSLSRILTFILFITISRFFSVELFGFYTYLTSLIFLFSPLINLGMNSVLQQELSLGNDDKNIIINTVILLKTLAFISLYICIFFLILFFGYKNKDYNIFFLIAFSSLLFVGPITVIPTWQNYNLKIKDKAVVNMTGLIIEKLLQFTGIILFHSYIFIFISMIFGSLIKAFYSIYFFTIKSDGIISLNCFNFDYSKKILKKGLPLLLTAFLIYVYSRIDQIMIAHMLGYKSTGLYASSAILFQSFFTFSGILTASLYPILLREKKQDNKKNYQIFLQSYFDIYSFFGMLIFIFLFFSSSLILSLFGPVYLSSLAILKLFSISLFLIFCLDGLNKVLITHSLYRILLYINLLSVIFNIVLNFFLIKSYGIFGAAIGTSLSMIFSILLFPLFFKKSSFCVPYIFNSYFFIFRMTKTIKFIKNYKIINLSK